MVCCMEVESFQSSAKKGLRKNRKNTSKEVVDGYKLFLLKAQPYLFVILHNTSLKLTGGEGH